MRVTKLKLSKKISEEVNIPLDTSKSLVKTFFNIKINLLKTHNLKLSKFGTYYKKISPPRIGRNPKTLKEYKIPSRAKISFKASKIIKDSINWYEMVGMAGFEPTTTTPPV